MHVRLATAVGHLCMHVSGVPLSAGRKGLQDEETCLSIKRHSELREPTVCLTNKYACVSCYAERGSAVRSMLCTKTCADSGQSSMVGSTLLLKDANAVVFPHQHKLWLGLASSCTWCP